MELNQKIINYSLKQQLAMILQYTLSKDSNLKHLGHILNLNRIYLILIKRETVYYARVLIKSEIKEVLP